MNSFIKKREIAPGGPWTHGEWDNLDLPGKKDWCRPCRPAELEEKPPGITVSSRTTGESTDSVPAFAKVDIVKSADGSLVNTNSASSPAV